MDPELVQSNASDHIQIDRNGFSSSPYGYNARWEEWEEALWKQKTKTGEKQVKKSQDKEIGWREPHTNGQILTAWAVCMLWLSWEKGGGCREQDVEILYISEIQRKYLPC